MPVSCHAPALPFSHITVSPSPPLSAAGPQAGVSSHRTFAVRLSPGIVAGFAFLMLNCTCVALFGVCNRGVVPKECGFVSAAM